MRVALTIAGSDPGGGAGIQADLKTFAAFGVYGASAITAITVQNTLGVDAVAPLAADLVIAQVEASAGDLSIDATKIGMLATAAIVEGVAAAIGELELPLIVLDPVLVSSSGERLLDSDGVQAMISELLPLARVVTPNIPEAEALSGVRIASPEDARGAARRIYEMGASAVIITGGHAGGTEVVDLLFDGHEFHEIRHESRAATPTAPAAHFRPQSPPVWHSGRIWSARHGALSAMSAEPSPTRLGSVADVDRSSTSGNGDRCAGSVRL
jgi:hydroxymethylpyrimidine/phosphomethylpyrimidine kinase